MSEPTIVQLAIDQLAAYNVADLGGFCARYHADVVVLDAEGARSLRGSACRDEGRLPSRRTASPLRSPTPIRPSTDLW